MGRKKKNKKPRPVAPVTHLMRPSNVIGWGEVDPTQVNDYGPDAWQPDEQFQRTNVFSHTTSHATGAGPSSSSQNVTSGVNHGGTDTDELCYLLLIIPPSLEPFAQRECERLWGSVHEVIPGRIVVAIQSMEDLSRANSLRCCSEIRVMVVEFEDYVLEPLPDHEFLDYMTNEVQYLPWTGPYQAWAMINGNAPVDPCSDPRHVLPKPSFRVRCTFSDAPSWNEAVCRSFEEGVVGAFQWEVNDISPAMDLLVEIQNTNITVSIELKGNMILDPLSSPYKPFKDNVVTYALAQLAELKFGDIVFNASCGVIDMSAEISKVQPETISIFGDTHRVTVYDAKQNLSRWNRQGSDPDGAMLLLEALAIRENTIDVLFAFLSGSKASNEYQNTRSITRQLREVARVCRRNIGRAVLLTSMNDEWIYDVIIRTRFWSSHQKIKTQFGNLDCLLFVLQRAGTSVPRNDSMSVVASASQQQGVSSRTSRGVRSNQMYRRRLAPSQSSGSSRHGSNTPRTTSEGMDWNTTF